MPDSLSSHLCHGVLVAIVCRCCSDSMGPLGRRCRRRRLRCNRGRILFVSIVVVDVAVHAFP